MMMTIPRDTVWVDDCTTSHALELEVAPGECVYANQMDGLPVGLHVPWDSLTADQRERFLHVRQELQAVAEKLKALLLGVGDVAEG